MVTDEKMAMRRLIFALCLSVLFHFVALSKFGMFSSGDMPTKSGPLNVSLTAPLVLPSMTDEGPPNKTSIAAPVPKKLEVPRESDNTKQVKSQPVKPVDLVPATVASDNLADAAKKSSPANPSSGIPLPGLIGPVGRADIEFEIFSGAARQSMGVAKHSYISDSGGNFGVSVKQQFNEGAAGQSEPWQLEISGSLTKQGLSPLLYEANGTVAERLIALKDSPEKVVATPNKSRKGRMPDGILDRQSLLYQFMVQPPLQGGGKLWLTDGITHGQYSYRLAGYDSLAVTAYGLVRALKLVISAIDGAESIELWLVPDLHYLPVKVRHVDRQGVVTEQMAVSIDFSPF